MPESIPMESADAHPVMDGLKLSELVWWNELIQDPDSWTPEMAGDCANFLTHNLPGIIAALQELEKLKQPATDAELAEYEDLAVENRRLRAALDERVRLEGAARYACDAFEQPIVSDENGSTDWCARDIGESMGALREALDATSTKTIQETSQVVLEVRADVGFEAMVELVRRRTAEEEDGCG
jgi:hypothetical protein